MTWHGAFSSASIIRVTASAAVTRTAGVVEQRLAEPSSGGSLRGYSACTTRTTLWPPGSRITTKASSPVQETGRHRGRTDQARTARTAARQCARTRPQSSAVIAN